jgi:hypothetical protein
MTKMELELYADGESIITEINNDPAKEFIRKHIELGNKFEVFVEDDYTDATLKEFVWELKGHSGGVHALDYEDARKQLNKLLCIHEVEE